MSTSWTSQTRSVYTDAVARLPGWLLHGWPLRRFVVADTSMRPALEPGDRLLVLGWLPPRVGDVVVVRDPEQPRTQYLVKRVAARNREGYVVLGDRPNVSRDSREFGPLRRGLVVGRVVYRYLPGARRGRVKRYRRR